MRITLSILNVVILTPATRTQRRPVKFKEAELEVLLDQDSCQTQEELTETLKVTQQAISNHLKATAMVQKQGNWLLYELKPRNVVKKNPQNLFVPPKQHNIHN